MLHYRGLLPQYISPILARWVRPTAIGTTNTHFESNGRQVGSTWGCTQPRWVVHSPDQIVRNPDRKRKVVWERTNPLGNRSNTCLKTPQLEQKYFYLLPGDPFFLQKGCSAVGLRKPFPDKQVTCGTVNDVHTYNNGRPCLSLVSVGLSCFVSCCVAGRQAGRAAGRAVVQFVENQVDRPRGLSHGPDRSRDSVASGGVGALGGVLDVAIKLE